MNSFLFARHGLCGGILLTGLLPLFRLFSFELVLVLLSLLGTIRRSIASLTHSLTSLNAETRPFGFISVAILATTNLVFYDKLFFPFSLIVDTCSLFLGSKLIAEYIYEMGCH